MNDVNVGDILIIERYHTEPKLAEYLCKRPWQVKYLYGTHENRLLGVLGMNLTDTNRTIGKLIPIGKKMLMYRKIYRITKNNVDTWINQNKCKN